MIVFVLNAGSSSLKYQVVDTEDRTRLRGGQVGESGEAGALDYPEAIRAAIRDLGDLPIEAVGHRVVHGGMRFRRATVVDDAVEQGIAQLMPLAPLHNGPGLVGIRAARAALAHLPHVAVFDTAFHATLPPAAYTYALDRALAERHGLRRFGFHGISYRWVSRVAAEMLRRPLDDVRMIVFHLGNGASAAAIRGGRSIDTSMGLTPLEGLVMGTRSGDLDPAVVLALQREAGLSLDEADDLLNRRSGLLGLSGHSDIRDVIAAADGGDEAASTALDVYVHRLRRYLGAYAVALGRLDAIVFTGGVGDNSSLVRERALENLGLLGVELDAASNAASTSHARVVSTPSSGVAVLVVPTNEEQQIALETADALEGTSSPS